jgi:serine/threonine-protein kinase
MDERPLPPEYEFVRALGAGAFGDVVLARQRSLDRLVAIKRIHRHVLTDADALVRFRREGQVLAGLHDPAIVRVYDFRTSGADALLVMEFVAGAPFDDVLERRSLPTPALLTVLDDVARALTVAAAAGVVHRDVKPGNVFVLDGGRAKLGDFGLARVVTDPAVFRTAGGAASGTPAYFPPEVSQGAEPDPRSDAYSFAVMAYEALVGRRPILADSPMAMIAAHWVQPVPRPETLVPGFPSAAADALVQALDKRRDARLLPAELMTRLHAVPGSAWPATRAPRADPALASDSTLIASTPMFPPAASRSTSTAVGQRRRWSWRLLVPLAALVGAAGTTGIVLARSGGSDPRPQRIAVRDVTVQVTPSSGRGRCPSAQFDFVGRIVTNGGAGQLTASWELPGGQRVAARPVDVAAGRRAVRVGVHFPVTGQRPLRGQATLRVEAGTVVTAHSSQIHYSW